jgi:hypothetical protein
MPNRFEMIGTPCKTPLCVTVGGGAWLSETRKLERRAERAFDGRVLPGRAALVRSSERARQRKASCCYRDTDTPYRVVGDGLSQKRRPCLRSTFLQRELHCAVNLGVYPVVTGPAVAILHTSGCFDHVQNTPTHQHYSPAPCHTHESLPALFHCRNTCLRNLTGLR